MSTALLSYQNQTETLQENYKSISLQTQSSQQDIKKLKYNKKQKEYYIMTKWDLS